jgi:uncharacterized protein YoaH (UPF0181 family)
MFGACGDDCSVCPRYKATITSDRKALERVKELWVLFGWRAPEVTAEELKCSGCSKDNPCSYQKLRDCAFGKGLKNCGLCASYPCSLVNAAFEKTENAFHSLKGLCSGEEMEAITKAFRYKKTNLDRIHKFFSQH